MEKVLNWQITNVEKVTKENVGEIMFTINPRQTGGVLAPFTSLKTIDVGLFLKRQNMQSEKKIFDGTLEDLLEHVYAGSTMLEVVKSAVPNGYNFRIKFGQFPIVLNAEDYLLIKLRAGKPSDTFTSAVLAESTIKLYTNPSPEANPYGLIPIYTTHSVGNGKVEFDENIGSNVAKIVLATDSVNPQTTSTKPKVNTSRLHSDGGYNEDFTRDELIAKNQELLAVNPDSPIRNLVHYASLNTLNDVNLEVTFDAQADNDTKILVTQLEVH